MASVFKQRYTTKDKDGKRIRKQSKCWYIDYKTADGTRKRVKGCKDKAGTAQLAAKLEQEAELIRRGIVDKYKDHRANHCWSIWRTLDKAYCTKETRKTTQG